MFLLRKTKMENSEVYQNSNTFLEKEADNSDVVFRYVLDSIISTISDSRSLNKKRSERILGSSDGEAKEEHEKMLKAKHQSHDSSHKLKILSTEECQSKFNIPCENCKVIENKSKFEKGREVPENQAVISKNSASEKCDILTKYLEDFNENLSEMKSEEKEPMLEIKEMESEGLVKNFVLVKDTGSTNENLEEAVLEECECNPLMKLPIEIASGEAERKLFDISKVVDNLDKNDNLIEEKANEDDETSGMPNEDAAFSNYLDITIPRIGKHVFQNEERPLTNCYDLGAERNEKRFNYMRESGVDDEILRLVDEEANISESDKKENKIKKQQDNIQIAFYVIDLCLKILQEIVKEKRNEKKIIFYLKKFLDANVTATCLLYVPHLVHTISFIRGRRVFKKATRLAADECYNYCHAMFPIPFGYNFETVYTSEMRKFLRDDFDKMENLPLDYGGIDDILENSDDENDENDRNNSDNNHSLL